MESRFFTAPAIAVGLILLTASGVARAQLTDAERKCSDAVNKRSRNIGNQEQKKNRACVKDGIGDIDSCIDIEGDKTATQQAKLVEVFGSGGKCETPPPFGVNPDPQSIADSTARATRNVLRGAFGDPVDGIIPNDNCQQKVAKRTGKMFDTEMKAFRKCTKDLAAINNTANIEACIGTGVADPKAQTVVEPKIESDMAACDFSGGAPPGFEDGGCSGCSDAATCATCLGHLVNCQVCQALSVQTGVFADCDVIDDLANNSSCICPLFPGHYTLTQNSSGSYKIYTFSPFPVPAGTTLVQDVGPGSLPGCVHNTVVPFPGGFAVPPFCVLALGLLRS
jgi:hypothetical protein